MAAAGQGTPEEVEPLAAASDAAARACAAAAPGRRTAVARRLAAGSGFVVAGALAAAALVAGGGSLRQRAPAEASAQDIAEEVLGLSSVIDEVSGAANALGILAPPVSAEGGQSMDLLAYAEELNRTTFGRQLQSGKKKHINLGACVSRAIATAAYFAFAGINVDSATKVCGSNGAVDKGKFGQLNCAVGAQWAASSFAWAGFFLAGTIDACSGGELKGASCAAASMELVAALLSASAGATAAVISCAGSTVMLRALENATARAALQPVTGSGAWPDVDGGGRRLQFGVPRWGWRGNNGLNGAYCAFDIIFTINWLAQAALSITRMALSRSCEHEAEQAKMACAGEILRTIASFAFTSSYISSAVSDCGNSLNLKAQCAADISMAVGGASFAAAAGISIHERCVVAERTETTTRSPLFNR